MKGETSPARESILRSASSPPLLQRYWSTNPGRMIDFLHNRRVLADLLAEGVVRLSRRHARIMGAFVSSDCITGSRTHDSVDPAPVIACTRQTELDFGNRGTPTRHDALVNGLIVRIVSIVVRIIFVRIIAVGIISIIVRIKERITKITEENEFVEVAMAEPIAISPKAPKVSRHSGTKARPGPCETRRHSGGCRTTAETAPVPLNPPPLKPPAAEPPRGPAIATETLKVIAATQLVNRIDFVFIISSRLQSIRLRKRPKASVFIKK